VAAPALPRLRRPRRRRRRLVHVDANRADEVADTVMALALGLLRRTHLLSRQASSSGPAAASCLPLCRGLVLGIVGRSTAGLYLMKMMKSVKLEMKMIF
jgi:phosphoglycerate dehydrogenase-like enzyme